MNDSVKLCIYLCGKDLHFYEKPQEFLPELFYSQFRMTLKIMTASSSCTLHSSVNGSGCLSLSRVLSRVKCLVKCHVSCQVSRVASSIRNLGITLYLSGPGLVMRAVCPQSALWETLRDQADILLVLEISNFVKVRG